MLKRLYSLGKFILISQDEGIDNKFRAYVNIIKKEDISDVFVNSLADENGNLLVVIRYLGIGENVLREIRVSLTVDDYEELLGILKEMDGSW